MSNSTASSSSSSADISASAKTHLQSCLHPAVVAPAALTSFLAEGCVPLDEAQRLAERKEAAEAAAAADAKPVVPRVRILDLSTAPPAEVDVLSAFGMQWAPTVQQPQAANIEVKSASGGPSSATDSKQPLVTFYSVQSALFQRPSAAVNEIVEVRESMQLPMGFVPLDGKVYYLMDGEAATYNRQAVVAQKYPSGVMQPPPFAAGLVEKLDSDRLSSHIKSSILTSLKHKQDLEKLFAPAKLPKLTLLWCGARDGFTADAFHSRCDNKGATLTVVRSGEYIFGGFNPSSWHSSGGYSTHSGCWLFSLSSPTGLLTKLHHRSGAIATLNSSYDGPTFGQERDLHISGDDMQSACNSHSRPSSYEVAPGFSGTTFTKETLAGKEYFAVDAIEVFRCR